jgi:large subunit ribosomal protein L3
MMLTGVGSGQTVAVLGEMIMSLGMLGLKVGMTQVYQARYKLTDRAIGELRPSGVPEPVAAKVLPLKDKEFATRDEFVAAITGVLEQDELERHRATMVKAASFGEKLAPVTVLQVGPNPVLQIRTQDRDGYDAVQVGFLDKKRNKASRAERGHVSADLKSKRRDKRKGVELPPKANCDPQKFIREFRMEAPSDLPVGKLLRVGEVFQENQAVDVTGTSKGRGTTGVMKRHNFKGLRLSHGVKKGSRQHGSTSSNASNRGSGRPKKGIRMAGRYGAEQVTIRNLTVVKIDAENHVLLVRGAVPGPNGGLISIRPTNKKKRAKTS